MGLSEIMILVMAVVGFVAGYLGAVLRHGDTWAGTPSASHNNARGEIECSLKCLSDHCTLKQGYCHNLKVVATSPIA